MIKFLTTIWNRRYDDSTKREPDEIAGEYVTVDRQIIRNKRQHELSFCGRRKGLQQEGLTVTKPSDQAFDRPMNYQNYRFTNTSHVRFAEEAKKLREQVKTFHATFENT